MEGRKFDYSTPVIAIDFDGVLCSDNYPEIGEPNLEVIQEAKDLQKRGACLILWTCRGGEDLERAVRACESWGLKFDAINENPAFMVELYGNDCRKVGATEYWDDRAVFIQAARKGSRTWRNLHGRSVYPMTRQEIRTFIDTFMRSAIEETVEQAGGRAERRVLKFALEIMEQLMAEADELQQVSLHKAERQKKGSGA